MYNKHYDIYQKPEYIEGLKKLIENSDYKLVMFSKKLKKEFKKYFIDYMIEELENDPTNVVCQNRVKFFEKSYYVMASGEFFLFNYYSEAHQKSYFVAWDSEGTSYHLDGDYVNFIDNTFFKDNIIKPDRLNFIRRCQAIGLKYKKLDSDDDDNESDYEKEFIERNKICEDVYMTAVLQY